MSFLKFFLPLEDVLQPAKQFAKFTRQMVHAKKIITFIHKQSKQMEFGQESLIEDTLKPFESDWEK